MRNSFTLAALAGLTLLLTACDPARTLTFENTSDTAMEVIITPAAKDLAQTRPAAYHMSSALFDDPQTPEVEPFLPIKFTLEPGQTKLYDFGVGTWDAGNLDSLQVAVSQFVWHDAQFKGQNMRVVPTTNLNDLLDASETRASIVVEVK